MPVSAYPNPFPAKFGNRVPNPNPEPRTALPHASGATDRERQTNRPGQCLKETTHTQYIPHPITSAILLHPPPIPPLPPLPPPEHQARGRQGPWACTSCTNWAVRIRKQGPTASGRSGLRDEGGRGEEHNSWLRGARPGCGSVAGSVRLRLGLGSTIRTNSNPWPLRLGFWPLGFTHTHRVCAYVRSSTIRTNPDPWPLTPDP
jgi:hypothetical protein